jgi:hypothetical protein
MMTLSERISLACCIVVIFGAAVGLCLVNAMPKFMACTYTTWINGEYKTKNTLCLQHPHVRQSKPATMAPTETATPERATATDEPFDPWSTATPYETSEPYPTQETGFYP